MTDKELRSLSRKDMLDLLCELKREEIRLKKQVKELQRQLDERDYQYEEAGTLAEAVISVNGVLEAAQRAADEYLAEIRKAHEDVKRNCTEMTSRTEERCRRREKEAEWQINSKWEAFGKKVDYYMQTNAEFEALRN